MNRIALSILVIFAAGCVDRGTLTVDTEAPAEDEEIIVIDTDDTPSVGSSTDSPSSDPATSPGDTSDGADDSNSSSSDDDSDSSSEDSLPDCSEDQAFCQGACIDVTQDDANCGDCDVMCGDGLICMAADCVCEVGELCGGECVDTTANAAHCGECDNPCSGGQSCVDGVCEALTEVEGVLLATNQARAQGQDCGTYGEMPPAPPLEGDPNLHMAAQMHADDMAVNNFFSHTGSDGSSFADRIVAAGYPGQPIGENIAAGNSTAEATVGQWLGSDGHCRNLMNPNATKLGVGYAEGGPYGTLWVQVFAR